MSDAMSPPVTREVARLSGIDTDRIRRGALVLAVTLSQLVRGREEQQF